jgi:hypothetical protein
MPSEPSQYIEFRFDERVLPVRSSQSWWSKQRSKLACFGDPAATVRVLSQADPSGTIPSRVRESSCEP